jgi:3-oxoacyl-(acyl-carrier-protein) synthase
LNSQRHLAATPALSITGLGCVSAAGIGIAETEKTLFEAPSGAEVAPEPPLILDTSEQHYFKLRSREDWAEYAAFIAAPGMKPCLFAILAAEEALSSAGITRDELANLRVGVCLGSTVGGTNYQETFLQEYFSGKLPGSDPLEQDYVSNCALFLSRHLGLNGPALTVNNACTSGADAIGIAANWLRADLCDVVLCGGTETILTKIYYGFRSLMLCSLQTCRPFDRARDGLSLGEGAGIVVLEKKATKRKPKVHLLGYAGASDSFHPTAPHPEARGLNSAALKALKQSNRNFADIDFVNAHATATPHNDEAEGRWLTKNLSHARISATKGFTGHTLGAAGGVEAVFTALSLMHGKLPASRGFSNVDPEIGVIPTLGVETGSYKSALSISLGFGGTNSVLCLGRTEGDPGSDQ